MSDTPSAADHVLGREDLRQFHRPRNKYDRECFHGGEGAWSDSAAWTHCICFGAAVRAVEPLLIEIAELRAELERAHDVRIVRIEQNSVTPRDDLQRERTKLRHLLGEEAADG